MKNGMKPSMRPKKRYIAFEIFSDEKITKEDFVRALWSEIMAYFGENISSEMNLWVLDLDTESSMGFLVCRRDMVQVVKTGLGMIHAISGKAAGVRVRGVSGTVKSLKKKFLIKGKRIKEESEEIDFDGETFKIVRSYGDCIDAVPVKKGFADRLKVQNRKFIGFIRKDIGR